MKVKPFYTGNCAQSHLSYVLKYLQTGEIPLGSIEMSVSPKSSHSTSSEEIVEIVNAQAQENRGHSQGASRTDLLRMLVLESELI